MVSINERVSWMFLWECFPWCKLIIKICILGLFTEGQNTSQVLKIFVWKLLPFKPQISKTRLVLCKTDLSWAIVHWSNHVTISGYFSIYVKAFFLHKVKSIFNCCSKLSNNDKKTHIIEVWVNTRENPKLFVILNLK